MSVNLFDTNFYRAVNTDLAGFSDAQALSHFQNYGLNEGRRFSALVDLSFYRASNSDLANFSNRQAYEHLQNYGVLEGRRFSPFVDLNFYKVGNSDLANFGNEQILGHLQNYGVSEGRRFSPFVDLNFYRAANGDLANFSYNQALQHLEINGVSEGRRFSVAFDTNYYRTVNPDLISAGLNNRQLYEHFQLNGLSEGRASSQSFNVRVYLTNNSDLQAARFNYQQAYNHFLLNGQQEGRAGSDYAGNTTSTARQIGTLTNSATFFDYVDYLDTNDYYQFNLSNVTNFNLSLNGLGGNADVQLLDGSSNLIQSSTNISTTAESITRTLNAGTYYIRVYPYGAANTYYNLSVSSISAQIDPGNTLGTAEVEGSAVFLRNEQVSVSDRDDFYRFTVSQSGVFTGTLTGLNGDADIRLIQDINGNGVIDTAKLYDSATGILDSGEILAWQWERGTTSESIRRFLNPGTYYLQVMSYNNQTANYNLSTSFTPGASDNRSFSFNPTFTNAINATARATIQKAINFWQNAISYTSFNTSQTFNLDLIEDTSITGNTLATGGWLTTATDSNGRVIPTSGRISLSTSYLSSLNTIVNYTPDTIIHEIGHALGLAGLLNSSAVNRSTGTYSANTYAGWVYGDLKGTFTQTAIPMTTGVGSGSDYSHWKEEVFGNETMTHLTRGATSAVSQLSLAAMRDIGWNINYGAAQPYVLPTGGTGTSLGNVVYNYNNSNPVAPSNTFSGGSYSYSVNSEFTDRLHRINFNGIGALNVTLNSLTANADMRLIYDANNNGIIDAGEVIATSANTGTTSESFNLSNLAAGSYYIDVYATNYLDSSGNKLNVDTNYTLNFSTVAASAPPLVIGGNLTSITYNFGNFNSGLTYSGGNYSSSVGDSNIDDVFRFSFGGTTNLNLSLNNLTANADMRLIFDANNNGVFDVGEEITNSTNSGSTSETISRSGLAAGTYYVNVYRVGSTPNTPYKLNLVNATVA